MRGGLVWLVGAGVVVAAGTLVALRSPSTSAPAPASEPQRTRQIVAGVVHDPQGQPLPGVKVGRSSEIPIVVETDANGRFELPADDVTKLDVYAVAPGYATRLQRGVAAGTRDLVLRLEPPGRVIGTLAPATAGAYLVSLCALDPALGHELCSARVLVGAQSPTFALPNLSAGEHSLVVELGDQELARRAVTVELGKTTDVGSIVVPAPPVQR